MTSAPLPATAAETPIPVVTIIHYISQVRDVKDSDLRFTLRVPVEWDIRTVRLDEPGGLLFRTSLGERDTFTIISFANIASREDQYRTEARHWLPAPVVTAPVINDIPYDRFESTANGTTRVMYIPRAGFGRDRKYLSILAYSADTGNRFGREDNDRIVATFRSYPGTTGTLPGEEIPLFDAAGNPVLRPTGGQAVPGTPDTSDWDTGTSPGEEAPSSAAPETSDSSDCNCQV